MKQKMAEAESLILLDVREPWEYQMSHLPDSVLIPLGKLFTKIGELDKRKEIVTLCHHGIRSQMALGILLKNGFTKVKNLAGGIDAYSRLADPTIPRY
ncbi:MAG: rhodanese-like domain-containing protein [Nitrospiria bacterium]